MFIDCFLAFFMPLEELDDEIRLVNWPTCNASLIPSSKNHSQGASTGRSPIRQIARTPLSSDAPFMEVAKREKRPALRATVQMTRRIYIAGVIRGEWTIFFIVHAPVFLPSKLANPCATYSEVKNARIDEHDGAIIANIFVSRGNVSHPTT